jgi:response regulator RpfG family c-di-GMP phosphodiesterase
MIKTLSPTFHGAKILYIEDDPASIRLVRKILEAEGYRVSDATDGLSGIQSAIANQPDLILMDINIPELNGYEATTKLKSLPQLKDVPIVALTGHITEGDKERTIIAGCDGYIQKPIDPELFPTLIREFLAGKKERISLREEKIFLNEYKEQLVNHLEAIIRELQDKNELLRLKSLEMEEVYVNIMHTLMRAMEAKHEYTAGHSERVERYCFGTAQLLGLTEAETKVLTRGARLHDIGKIVIDLSSINKPGKLTDEEWQVMREHPSIGASILAPLRFLEREVFLVRHHHERFDGSGFPDKLAGDEIDDLTYILILADSFDAMTTNRPYRSQRSFDEAVEELLAGMNRQYKPAIIEAFIESLLMPTR